MKPLRSEEQLVNELDELRGENRRLKQKLKEMSSISDRAAQIWPLELSIASLSENEGKSSMLVNSLGFNNCEAAETKLKSSLKRERFLADIFHKSPFAIALSLPNGKLDDCNLAYLELTGYSFEELKSFSDYRPFTPEKWQEFEAKQMSKLSPLNNYVRYAKEYIRKDGKLIPIELLVTAQYDDDNEMTSYIAYVSDVTDSKASEAEISGLNQELEQRVEQRTADLAASAERLCLATKVANLGIWEWDINKDVVIWDDAMFALHKIKVEEFDNRKGFWLNLIHACDKKRVEDEIQLALKGEKDFNSEFRVVLSDGIELYMHVIAAVERDINGEPVRLLGVSWDITEQKKAQSILQESENRFRSLFENSPIAYQSLDKDGCFIDLNNELVNLLGYSKNELLGKTFGDFWSSETKASFHDRFCRFKKNGEAIVELSLIKKDGTIITVLLNGRVQYDNKGCFVRTHCVLHNISERKDAEDDLRASKLFIQSVLDTLSPQIVVFDSKATIQLANESWRNYWSVKGMMKEGEEKGKNYFKITCPSEKHVQNSEIYQGIQSVIKGDEDLFAHVFRHLWNGKETFLSMNVHRVNIGSETAIVLSTQDITELKAAEKGLVKAKDRAETAADIARLGHFEFDLNTREFRFNDQYYSLLDTSIEQEGGVHIPLDTYIKEFVFPDDKHILLKQIGESLEQEDGYTGECEYRAIARNQELRHMFVRFTIIKNAENFKISGIHQDISERKEIEKALEAAKDFADRIVDFSPIPMVVTSIETGELIRANQAMCELNKLSVEELSAYKVFDFYADFEKDRPKVLDELRALGRVDNFELKIKRLGTGEERWSLISIYPIYYEDQQAVISTIIDITERKQAVENITKLSSAVEQSSASVVITDLDGDIQYVNQAFVDITGYTFEEIRGENPRILNSGAHDEKFYRDMWDVILEGKVWEGDMVNKKKNGELFWESASIAPVSNDTGELINFIAVKSDITEIKKVERELIEAKELAEAATIAKSQFLANMSHEIRTPMNAIMGLSKLALKTDLNYKQWDYLSKIDESSQNLLRIINDILDFSKIEAGKLSIEKINFNLEDMMQAVSNLTAPKAQENGVEFILNIEKGVPVNLIGDPLRISQLITNYCSNAVKFTEIGEVILTASLIKMTKRDAEIKFSVADTGIGLTSDQIKGIFQSFSQADQSTTRKYGGTGLGLAICKNLAELMDGEVDFESEYGKGSTFIFTAKFSLQKEQNKRQLLLPEDLKGLRVLACDDNKSALAMLKERLEHFSFKVDAVSNVKDAIVRIQNQGSSPYKLLVMDYDMPDIDGITGYEMLTRDEQIQLPFTLMINVHQKHDVIKLVEDAGIENYLTKPVTSSPLFDSVIKAFGKSPLIALSKPVINDIIDDQLKIIRGARILLVEDVEVNQQIAKEFLEDTGFIVDIAENGQEAVEKVKANAFDLVFMDLQMPVMDGYDACLCIRMFKNAEELPIVAMTADAMQGVKKKCLAIGMQDMVSKPINPELLFKTLIKWIVPKNNKVQEKNGSPKKDVLDVETPEISGLNLVSALPRFNYNMKHFRNVLQSFHDNNQTVCSEIQKQFEIGAYIPAQRKAHSLKGLSASVGSENIPIIAKELEQSIIHREPLTFKNRLQELDKALKSLFAEIAPQFALTPTSCVFDYKLAIQLMAQLREHLEAKNADAKLMISQMEDAGFNNLIFTRLKKALNGYDFKMALIQLNELEKLINTK